jgi:GDP-L-fucose synthase
MKEEHLLSSELEYTNEPYAIAKIAGLKMCEAYNLQYGTDFISVMPTNLYGPNDNYSLENSHVLPALIRKIHLSKCLEQGDFETIHQDLLKHGSIGINAESGNEDILLYLKKYGIEATENSQSKTVRLALWGTGSPLREFLWSDDMADACVFLMEKYSFNELKIATGKESETQLRNMHVNIGSGNEISIKGLAEIIQKVVGFTGEITFDPSKPDGTPRKLLDVSRLNKLGWKSKVSLEEGINIVYKNYIKS